MERFSNYDNADAIVSAVIPDSIADELEIIPGAVLLEIDGHPVIDVFDYRLRQKSEELLLLFRFPDGELYEFEIEKDEDEDLGIEFENPLLCGSTHCDNRCVFCFIDQLPKGMRKTLYFKDDDSRLSFLTGNYVTLTNMSDTELDRIISCRFSPLNISVHSTNPELRVRMMGNERAALIIPQLQRIIAAGLELNAQVVLCPGWNDGAEFERTVRDLLALDASLLRSIAVVPVGLTKHRDARHLPTLSACTSEDAIKLLAQVKLFQDELLEKLGRRLVFAADEFYLKAGVPLPEAEEYEDFPQLENGVGMISLFREDFSEAVAEKVSADICGLKQQTDHDFREGHTLLLTGILAAPIIRSEIERNCQNNSTLSKEILIPEVIACENEFFGPEVTVVGLLTGSDLRRVIQEFLTKNMALSSVIICESMLKSGERIFLDDISIDDLANEFGIPVYVSGEGGRDLYSTLAYLKDIQREAVRTAEA